MKNQDYILFSLLVLLISLTLFCVRSNKAIGQTITAPNNSSGLSACVSCLEPVCNPGEILSFPKDSCAECPKCIDNCECQEGERFDGEKCLKGENVACILLFDPVCGCDRKTYSNSCFAYGDGVKSFTKGECNNSSSSGELTCTIDSDCPPGSCPDGFTYQNFSCLEGKCNQLNFFADPCLMHSLLNKNFSGIWRGRTDRASVTRTKTNYNQKCIECPIVQLLCAPGFEPAPDTCTKCAHCKPISQRASYPVILKLCVRNGKITGTVHIPKILEQATIVSQNVISENIVELIVTDRLNNSRSLTLELLNRRIISGTLDTGETFKARKISIPRNCIRPGSSSTSSSSSSGCASPCGPKCCLPGQLCEQAQTNSIPPSILYSCTTSSSGGFEDCGSIGSCRGQNGEELPCPSGTECSGLPAYGCYPPGCPVPICLSPDTRIKTTGVEKRIADIMVGDLIITDTGKSAKVKKIGSTKVKDHNILHVKLNDATVLEISPGHPTADGRKFKNLKTGDLLDGRVVVEVKTMPYKYSHTYDILPDSETGHYYANGILIGSTLK